MIYFSKNIASNFSPNSNKFTVNEAFWKLSMKGLCGTKGGSKGRTDSTKISPLGHVMYLQSLQWSDLLRFVFYKEAFLMKVRKIYNKA